MTQTLEQAITELSKLSPEEQDRIGQWLLDELFSEQGWDSRFRRSSEALSKLADEARADVASGRATTLDPDAL